MNKALTSVSSHFSKIEGKVRERKETKGTAILSSPFESSVPPVFGAPLHDALQGQIVPPFMKKCMDYIKERGVLSLFCFVFF
jgi:hypothetical protein